MTSEQSASLLEGVYVANVTPFLDDDRYSIDARVYEAHVRWLADHGVTGIVPFGTNGEGPSIAAREKRPLFEALAAAGESDPTKLKRFASHATRGAQTVRQRAS